ncbi:phage tail spike protein, partial [Jeotgalibaca porci]|uniref:phage tail spike protein n=1 Tax=Jeotgalibaca porci TaxID=1868793 RepID=UPI0035A1B4F2
MSKYPILYKGDATDFFTLGLGPIQMLKATVTQERNGIFIFEGEILTDSPLFPLVLENYIIKADADHFLKDQRFRIKRIVPNHDGKAEIYAEHVSYLSRELTIKPEVSITGSAQTALSQWKASIVEPNLFVVDSDIPTSNKTKWRIDKVENPRMALGGVEGSILDVWGGEYRFDNYHISLLQKRGTTAKTVLAYGRNITDFEQERNIANTYTSIMPYAIYNDANDNEVLVHIDGYVVDSEHINKYPNRVVQAVNFSSEFEHDEVPTKVRLLALANHYIKANEIGVPSTSSKVSFVDLSKSPDYAEYAFLEQVNLCDDVRVYYPKLGVNTVAKVIRTVWNVLTESYDEIEIGQKRMSLVGQMQQQQQAIKEINTQTNYAMTSADGKNTIFYGLYGENGLGEPKAIKVGDTWYKPNGTGTDMLVWTGTIWQVVLNAETFNQINEKIDQAEKNIAQNIIDIESTLAKATQAELDAGFSKDLAEEAKALGVSASSLAGEATTNANTAMADAQEAIRQVLLNEGVVEDASAEATEAKRLAGLAESNAQEALTKANASVTDSSTALTNATKAFNKSIKSTAIAYTTSTNGSTPPTTGWGTTVPSPSPDVYIWTRTTIVLNDNTPVVSYSVGKIGAKGDQGLKGDTGGQGIQGVPGANAPTIKSVVQQFYLSTSNSTQTGGSWLSTVPVWSSGKYYWVRVLTTYSNNATSTSTPVLDNALNDSLITALEVKTANQTLSTTVTQHATLIESKANSTTVDAIAGRVTTTEGSISTIAGQVALKASTTDVNTLTGRVTTAEGTITAQAGQIALRATTATVNTLTGRVSTAEGKITTQAGLIELKADTTTVNTLTGRVNAAEASLSVQSGKIDLAATKTELTTAIDGIEIGGRNLLKNSDFEKGTEFWQQTEGNTRVIDEDGYLGNGLRIISNITTTIIP